MTNAMFQKTIIHTCAVTAILFFQFNFFYLQSQIVIYDI